MPRCGSRLVVCALAALFLSACSISLDAEKISKTEERRFAVSGAPEVFLKTFDGAIRVQSWDKPEVLVTIERQAGNEEALRSLEVKADQQGDHITIEAVQPPAEGLQVGIHIGRAVNLTVSLPRKATVTARTGDGSVHVQDVAGRVDVTTGDGSLTVKGTEGDLYARTGDGSITLEGVRGGVELTTGDGHVKVDGVLQRLKARTGDGGIDVRAGAGSAAAAEWSIESGDGAVAVQLPDGFSAELEARSGDGRVSVTGFDLANATKREDGREVTGRLGAGGSRVTIRTGDGAISVKKI